jgi:serine/threonine protein kinase
MGVVYAAYDETLDRRVALKVLRRDTGGRESVRRRMLREAQGLARLSHPNVVQVYEVGELGGQVFIAMEYLPGRTIREWLAAGPRDWRAILDVFVQAGSGLAAAHAAKLVHRDFKPENAIVADDLRVRVVDFGLVRDDGGRDDGSGGPDDGPAAPDDGPDDPDDRALTQSGALIGTPAYMSPEQHDRRPADARSDQFSFCVALWEALYGHRPFHGTTRQAIAAYIDAGQLLAPPANSPVPARVQPQAQARFAHRHPPPPA